ncbi:cell wall-binding repeat-containing protein [Kineococcus sp. SYSU DK003]|uniref:cell wall-binding repeat-containing protein n=1 Tax=Kineococcus sp. SYSU DK003 TaxID=3383124 RepID=UPI003D7D4AC7
MPGTPLAPRRRRRAAAALTALALAALGLAAASAVVAAQAQAAPTLTLERLAGADRYATAITASRSAFADDSLDAVVLASGTSTVDALAAAAVAGVVGSPVLLTPPDALDAAVLAEIRRLGAGQVVLAGGEAAISPAVSEVLEPEFAVTRVAGTDRYDTAALLAAFLNDAEREVVFIAAGPVDAAAVAPIAAARQWPVLLTDPRAASPQALAALEDFPDARRVVVGGPGVLSQAVADRFGAEERLEGTDRYATATAIARFAVERAGFPGDGFGLALGSGGATGTDLADALTSGPVLGRAQAPLLLTASRDDLGQVTAAHLAANAARLSAQGLVFGGPGAVSQSVVAQAAAAAGTTAPAATATDG